MEEKDKLAEELTDDEIEAVAGGMPPRAAVPRGSRETKRPAGNEPWEAVVPRMPV